MRKKNNTNPTQTLQCKKHLHYSQTNVGKDKFGGKEKGREFFSFILSNKFSYLRSFKRLSGNTSVVIRYSFLYTLYYDSVTKKLTIPRRTLPSKRVLRKNQKAYCVSPTSLISTRLFWDESPAFFKVSPTIIILDLSALPYKQQESQTKIIITNNK